MFNLLPESLKDQIKSEYKARRVVVLLFVVIFVQICGLIFTFPSWLISSSKQIDLVSQTEKLSQTSLNSGATEIKDRIVSINSKITLLSTSLQYPIYYPYVDYVLSKKTSSIKIISFIYTVPNPKSSTFTIQGVADTREALVSFVDSLRADNKFKKVDLPVSNLAKNKNIAFTVIMTVSI